MVNIRSCVRIVDTLDQINYAPKWNCVLNSVYACMFPLVERRASEKKTREAEACRIGESDVQKCEFRKLEARAPSAWRRQAGLRASGFR